MMSQGPHLTWLRHEANVQTLDLGPCHTTDNFHEPVALIGRAALPLTTQAAL